MVKVVGGGRKAWGGQREDGGRRRRGGGVGGQRGTGVVGDGGTEAGVVEEDEGEERNGLGDLGKEEGRKEIRAKLSLEGRGTTFDWSRDFAHSKNVHGTFTHKN